LTLNLTLTQIRDVVVGRRQLCVVVARGGDDVTGDVIVVLYGDVTVGVGQLRDRPETSTNDSLAAVHLLNTHSTLNTYNNTMTRI